MYDVLIKGGNLIDGLGGPGNILDLGIVGEKIVAIGPELHGASITIDASDRIVCPGFIDMHSHSGLVVLERPELAPKLRQGITTEVVGVDGMSVAPVTDSGLIDRKRYVAGFDGIINKEWLWRTFPDYVNCLKASHASTNLVPLIPHGAIREVTMGWENRLAKPGEIAYMCSLVQEAFEHGAGGISFGLIYAPCAFANKEEIVALSAVAADFGYPVAVHVRNEASLVVQAIREMADMSVELGAKVHISHLKIIGKENQHLLPLLLKLFDDYAQAGFPLSFDQYPYNAGCTQLATLLPIWSHNGGPEVLLNRLRSETKRDRMRSDMKHGLPGWENLSHACGWNNIIVSFVASQQNKCCVGSSIEELAILQKKSPYDIVFDLLLEEELQVSMIDYYGVEDVKVSILTSKFLTVGTDGIFSNHYTHPRLYGTFPRILGRYVREEQILSPEAAINRMCYEPAQILGLKERGSLQVGFFADVVVFDPDSVIDTGTYKEPEQFPLGIDWVIVNGKIAVDESGVISCRNGRVLTNLAS